MDKQNPYRFSIMLDGTDRDSREVAAFLNTLGRKKGRVIVKAVLAYMQKGQPDPGGDAQGRKNACAGDAARGQAGNAGSANTLKSQGKDPCPADGPGGRTGNGYAGKCPSQGGQETEAPGMGNHAQADGRAGYGTDRAEIDLMRRNYEKKQGK